jgi:hypothetical protein
MTIYRTFSRMGASTLLVLAAFAALGSTGCTTYQNGMTLPNPYYPKNHVQFFPRGTEFPFANEAAILQESDRDFHRAGDF